MLSMGNAEARSARTLRSGGRHGKSAMSGAGVDPGEDIGLWPWGWWASTGWTPIYGPQPAISI